MEANHVSINTPMGKDNVVVYAMEYYAAVRKNEILPFVTTCTVLGGMMENDISETEKDKYCMISFVCRI